MPAFALAQHDRARAAGRPRALGVLILTKFARLRYAGARQRRRVHTRCVACSQRVSSCFARSEPGAPRACTTPVRCAGLRLRCAAQCAGGVALRCSGQSQSRGALRQACVGFRAPLVAWRAHLGAGVAADTLRHNRGVQTLSCAAVISRGAAPRRLCRFVCLPAQQPLACLARATRCCAAALLVPAL
jgi:hypothetical protein